LRYPRQIRLKIPNSAMTSHSREMKVPNENNRVLKAPLLWVPSKHTMPRTYTNSIERNKMKNNFPVEIA
jgi:hypothetical protein